MNNHHNLFPKWSRFFFYSPISLASSKTFITFADKYDATLLPMRKSCRNRSNILSTWWCVFLRSKSDNGKACNFSRILRKIYNAITLPCSFKLHGGSDGYIIFSMGHASDLRLSYIPFPAFRFSFPNKYVASMVHAFRKGGKGIFIH